MKYLIFLLLSIPFIATAQLQLDYTSVYNLESVTCPDTLYGIVIEEELLTVIEIRSFPDAEDLVFYMLVINNFPVYDNTCRRFLQFETVEDANMYLITNFIVKKNINETIRIPIKER